MGTTWRVDLFAPPELGDANLRAAVCEVLDRVNEQMSHWREDSHLSRFNRAEAGSEVRLPPDLFFVLETALGVARQTGGAFDPAVGALVDLWGFGPGGPRSDPPAPAAIAAALGRGGADRIRLRRARGVACQPGGVVLDLSSIAKGFAVDRVTEVLVARGVPACLVEIGGELRGYGVKSWGDPWWVAVERPPGLPQCPETVIALCHLSVATSGGYRRFFDHGSARYTHTMDPRTGHPVRHALASVTVVHERCMLADAYSTALAVLGAEEGLDLAERLGLAALFVLPRGEVRLSRAFAAMTD